MTIPAAQDPTGAFDYADLTSVHDMAYDTLYGVFLSSGWFLALAAGVVIIVVRRVDKSRVPAVWAKRSFAAAGLLLAVPIGASFGLVAISAQAETVPNFVGLTKGAKTSDATGEFISWAQDRYQVGLTEIQAEELQKLTNKGFMVTSNETHPVIHNGALIHGTSAAGQIILVDKDDKELPVHE